MFSLVMQLDRVGDRLEQAERPDPVRADPVLEPRGDLPLGPDHVGHDAREQPEEADDQPEQPDQPLPRRQRRGTRPVCADQRQVNDNVQRLSPHGSTGGCSLLRPAGAAVNGTAYVTAPAVILVAAFFARRGGGQ